MSKKYYLLLVLPLLVLSLGLIPSLASAEDDQSQSVSVQANVNAEVRPKPGILQKLTNLIKKQTPNSDKNDQDREKKVDDQGVRGDVQKKVEKRDTRFDNMMARFKATLDRLESIYTRIQTKIGVVKGNGGNTDKASTFMVQARAELDLAKSGIADLQIALDRAMASSTLQTSASSTPRKMVVDLFGPARKISVSITKHLNTAQMDMLKAVASLRPLVKSETEVEASTTTKTN